MHRMAAPENRPDWPVGRTRKHEKGPNYVVGALFITRTF